MRRALVVSTAICVGSAFLGCNSSSSHPPSVQPVPAPDTSESRGWSIKLKSKCNSDEDNGENVDGETCIGQYGFAVHRDGHFEIGPGPENEVRSGNISSEELQQLSATLAGILPSPSLGEANHQEVEPAEGENTVTLNLENGSENVLLRVAGSDLSYNVQAPEEAKAIYHAIRNLAEKYYHLPFPDDCLDRAVPATLKLYASMQSCATDSDCSYLDSEFDLIDSRDQSRVVTTDDCTLLHGLPVANASRIKSDISKLEELFSVSSAVCGQRMYRENCSMAQLSMNGSAPICNQGTCQLSPQLR